MERLLEIALAAVAGLWIGSYLTSYMKKKGENLATHEDIDKLVAQMVAVTQATKEIESKISDDVWDRQKRWEMKRDAMFAAAKNLYAMHEALLMLNSTWTVVKNSSNPSQLMSKKSEAIDQWRQASINFDAAEVQTSLICGERVGQTLSSAALLMRRVARDIFADDLNKYNESLLQIVKACELATVAIRNELGFERASVPQFNLSPESQNSGHNSK